MVSSSKARDQESKPADGSVAKNERFVVKTGRLPHPSHTGSLLWPNPIHSNGVNTRAKSPSLRTLLSALCSQLS
jgi:hypothetical protein